MTSQLPCFCCLFLSCQQQKNPTKIGAAVTSLRSFLFRDNFRYYFSLVHFLTLVNDEFTHAYLDHVYFFRPKQCVKPTHMQKRFYPIALCYFCASKRTLIIYYSQSIIFTLDQHSIFGTILSLVLLVIQITLMILLHRRSIFS